MDEELSDILTKLWNMDTNYSQPGVHYELDKQGIQSIPFYYDLADEIV